MRYSTGSSCMVGGGGKDVHMPFEYQLAVDAAKSKGSGHQGPMGGHKHILFLDL